MDSVFLKGPFLPAYNNLLLETINTALKSCPSMLLQLTINYLTWM